MLFQLGVKGRVVYGLFFSLVRGTSSLFLLRSRRSMFALGVVRRAESLSNLGLLFSAVLVPSLCFRPGFKPVCLWFSELDHVEFLVLSS